MECTNLTTIEFIELDKLLVFMLEEGFISDLNYRSVVASTASNLAEKRNVIFNLIQDKCLSEALNIWMMLNKLMWIHSKGGPSGIFSEKANFPNEVCHVRLTHHGLIEERAKIYELVSKNKIPDLVEIVNNIYIKLTDIVRSGHEFIDDEEHRVKKSKDATENAMLNDVIIGSIFEFLPTGDVMNFRTVCRKWNLAAEPLLRKTTRIRFQTLKPEKFLAMYKYSLPAKPFTSFTFRGHNQGGQMDKFSFERSKIENFLEKNGAKIVDINFHNITMTDHNGELMLSFEIISWLAHMPKLRQLSLHCNSDAGFRWNVRLNELTSIEALYLSNCKIDLALNNLKPVRISPLKVELRHLSYARDYHHVGFPFFDDELTLEITGLIDFSNTSEICIVGGLFDMARDEFNAKRLSFHNCVLRNWQSATGKVESILLNVSGSRVFSRARNSALQVKVLDFMWRRAKNVRRNDIDDLCDFPNMIEKLRLRSEMDIICRGILHMPNLKGLHVDGEHMNLSKVISSFANCENLINLEIFYSSPTYSSTTQIVDVCTIPGSVRKMKLQPCVDFVQSSPTVKVELDVLILNGFSLKDSLRVLSVLNSEVVVLKLYKPWESMDEIASFVLDHKNLKKLIVGPLCADALNYFFKESLLADIVDKQSSYYQFENQQGKGLTLMTFNKWLELYEDESSFQWNTTKSDWPEII